VLGDAKSSLGAANISLGDAYISLGDAESSLDDAESSLGDGKSSLGDAKISLGDAKSSLGDAESSRGDAESSLGDAKSSLGDAKSSLVTLLFRRLHMSASGKQVAVKATGGGAYKFQEEFRSQLGIELQKQDEMRSLVAGSDFFLRAIEDEVFTFQAGVVRRLWP
jgi:hypothetical protein